MNTETHFDCLDCEDIFAKDEAHYTDEGMLCFDCYANRVLTESKAKIEKIIGKEQYALWEKLKGTPEYYTYCGVPGCLNYMLGLPFSKYLVEDE